MHVPVSSPCFNEEQNILSEAPSISKGRMYSAVAPWYTDSLKQIQHSYIQISSRKNKLAFRVRSAN